VVVVSMGADAVVAAGRGLLQQGLQKTNAFGGGLFET